MNPFALDILKRIRCQEICQNCIRNTLTAMLRANYEYVYASFRSLFIWILLSQEKQEFPAKHQAPGLEPGA